MASYEELRQKHVADSYSQFREYKDRVSWPADRLQKEREDRLRILIDVAKERSPWYQQRLAAIDTQKFSEADLESIPPMTKHDLMENWDDIVTDPRLNLELVNSHIDTLKTDKYLFDHYHAVASGGSTGVRGVFVYDWASWIVYFLSIVRWNRGGSDNSRAPEAPPAYAEISASKATHVSSAVIQTFFSSPHHHRFPITLPIERIVEELNKLQPTSLGGYPSALYLLAHEARDGRLRISPRFVGTYAEPLLPEIRKVLDETWGASVGNMWACSEGGVAVSCGHGGMHLNDDVTIIEPIDVGGRPVPPGVRSAKIYLTNLYNHALPLIRYEITDEMTFLDEPCPCGSVFSRIDDVQGRLDETFAYDSGVWVHPHMFRSVLGGKRNIMEYQVQQTRRGADISISCVGDVDVTALRSEIEEGLESLGLEEPDVSINQVEHFERLATGKLKRFIPLD
jgi:phenylacetate-CoA ligase